MGTVTVRKIDDELMRDLKISAARRGVSMEQEARDRLRNRLTANGDETDQKDAAAPRWRLKGSLEEILALGIRPDSPVDHKAESDALYGYMDQG